MYDIGSHLLPAFVAGYIFAALIHIVGLLLLYKTKFEPVNQRTIMINLACSELAINLLLAIVHTVVTKGLCKPESICPYFALFIYVFFVSANKLIMLCLIFDRMLDVYLHLKYPIYFSNNRVKRILMSLWLFSGAFSLTHVLMRIFKIALPTRRKILNVFLNGLNSIIVITVLMTYGFLYSKVRRFLAIDRRQGRVQPKDDNSSNNNSLEKNQRANFLLPCLIISTFIMFNATGDLLILYKNDFLKEDSFKSILSEVGHFLWILGWISDGILYIFMQRSIRSKLLSIFRRSNITDIISVP